MPKVLIKIKIVKMMVIIMVGYCLPSCLNFYFLIQNLLPYVPKTGSKFEATKDETIFAIDSLLKQK